MKWAVNHGYIKLPGYWQLHLEDVLYISCLTPMKLGLGKGKCRDMLYLVFSVCQVVFNTARTIHVKNF
jgi:hypothetical protein